MKVMRAPSLARRVERGNEPGTVPVRWHFYAGGALLALAAILLPLVGLVPLLGESAALAAFLAGCTLFVQGIAWWYLPSFAKRAVLLRPLAAFAGPVLLPLAVLAQLAGLDRTSGAIAASALSLFALILLASALAGPLWRSGVPFWREGPHRADDRAAALVLALSLVGMLAVPAVAALAPARVPLAWGSALLLFALGALAHLLPRSRSRASWSALVAAGALVGAAGIALLVAGIPFSAPLSAGFLVAALAIAPPGSTKRAGPRLAEAAPLLVLAAVALAAAIALALAGLARPGWLASLAALGLGLAGLSLLTLPVLFNQRPAARFVPALLLFAVLGVAIGLAGVAIARTSLALAIVAWLRVLWPLRRPRRECPPDDAEPS